MKLNKKSYSGTQKIFINGIIYGIDRESNIYEAMVIKDGIIIALGSNKEIKEYYTSDTEIIDLKARTVLPAFIDANCHISEKMIIKKDELSLFEASNIKDYLNLIQTYVDSHPKVEIIYGVGWKNSVFEGEEKDLNRYTEIFKGPSKRWLEKIRTSKPIILKSSDGHSLWLNDKAFEYFEITKETKVPIGGRIELDEQGELWGILSENAIALIDMKKILENQNYKDSEYVNTFVKFQSILHSYGITTICKINEEGMEIPLEIYKKLENEHRLKLRLIHGVSIKPKEICNKTICEQIHQLKRNRIIYKSELLDVSVAKFFADGLIDKMTAYLFKEYELSYDEFGKRNGFFFWDYDEFQEGIKMSNRLDFNVFIHATGDLACKLAIDGIEHSYSNNESQNFRNSLVNIDLITKYYMRRMKELNINAIIKPYWFYKDVGSSKNEVLAIGEERAHRQYPLKSLFNTGIITAGSSDKINLEQINPLKAIECSTIRNMYDFIPSRYPQKIDMSDIRYRLNPSERISIMESIKMFTINAAYVLGKENEVGSLEVGKKADIIVLNKNIFTSNILDIFNANVERTYFDGELVYLNE